MIDNSTSPTAARQYLRSVVVLDDGLLPELGEELDGDQSALSGLREFVSAFASSGLIAMPAVPTWSATDPDATQRFEEVGWLCGRADVIVLDWDMPEPDGGDGAGETAVRLIRLLTEPPNDTLRLIVIYSRGIRDDIAARLDAELGTTNNGGVWTKGPAFVAVIRKPGGIVDPDRDEEDPVSSIEELPERLTSLFDLIIKGIVPSTVVRGLAASRDRAGAIINRYTSVGDLGFLGEAIAKASVADALRQLLGAVQDDAFGGVQRQIEDVTSDALQARVASCSLAEGLEPGQAKAQLQGKSHASSAFKKQPSRWLDGTLDEQGLHRSDLAFGALVQTRIVTGEEIAPILQLGVVVTWPAEGQFGVCLMALCDAARSGSNRFPFAVFSATDVVGTQKFPLSFGSGDEHVSHSGLIEGSTKLRDLVFVDFVAGAKQPVTATRSDPAEPWVFTSGQTAYEYVCELRPQVAFKLSQMVVSDASRFGRYGLDLPEWIRGGVDGL